MVWIGHHRSLEKNESTVLRLPKAPPLKAKTKAMAAVSRLNPFHIHSFANSKIYKKNIN